jgi:hypothetical protein
MAGTLTHVPPAGVGSGTAAAAGEAFAGGGAIAGTEAVGLAAAATGPVFTVLTIAAPRSVTWVAAKTPARAMTAASVARTPADPD